MAIHEWNEFLNWTKRVYKSSGEQMSLNVMVIGITCGMILPGGVLSWFAIFSLINSLIIHEIATRLKFYDRFSTYILVCLFVVVYGFIGPVGSVILFSFWITRKLWLKKIGSKMFVTVVFIIICIFLVLSLLSGIQFFISYDNWYGWGEGTFLFSVFMFLTVTVILFLSLLGNYSHRIDDKCQEACGNIAVNVCDPKRHKIIVVCGNTELEPKIIENDVSFWF